MTASIIPFPGTAPRVGAPTSSITQEWTDQHLPLIEAAIDMLATDDAEFARRCSTIVEAEGRDMLDVLTGQIERLQRHVAGVVEALAMTAMRIRTTMTRSG